MHAVDCSGPRAVMSRDPIKTESPDCGMFQSAVEVSLGAHGAAVSVGCTLMENRKGVQFWGLVLGLSTLGAFARARFLGPGLAR